MTRWTTHFLAVALGLFCLAGDIQIRALDPAYATPGPDEVQKF